MVQASDRESSSLVVTEDVRLLREFKMLMTENRETRTMKMLNRTIYSLLIVLVVIISVEFSYKLQQQSDIVTGGQIIYESYLRQDIIGDVLYNCRLLDLLSLGTYLPP